MPVILATQEAEIRRLMVQSQPRQIVCKTLSRGKKKKKHLHKIKAGGKLWKQSKCLTTDEWIKKMWYLYTMKFYSAMKKNEILSFASKWMELENIILSEVSQAQKTKNHMFSLICRL
jgi:hypothetical protein